MNVRAHFPVLAKNPSLVYLDSASTTLVPQAVIDKVQEFLSNIVSSSRRGAHTLAIQGGSVVEETRKKVASFLDSEPSLISFQKSIPSTATSFALGYDWKNEGRNTILVAASEEHSILVPLQRVSQLLNLEIKPIQIDDKGLLDFNSLENLLNEKVGIVAVGSTTIGWGIHNPLQKISKLVHEYGAILLSDMSRSFAYDLPSLIKSGPDLMITSANTSFMAPPGLSIQWISESVGFDHTPGILGGSSVSNVNLHDFEVALQPDKFESGTLNVPAIAGLGAALDYIQRIGSAAIASHLGQLAIHTIKKLSEIESLNLYGHPNEHSTIFGFNIGSDDLTSCHDIALFLDESNIATRSGLLCAHPLVKRVSFEGVIQASFGIYNTIEEIDLLADILDTISKDLI